MSDATLPSEFAALANKVHSVTQYNYNHFRSTCPQCGDAGHDYKSGKPDRFQMWLISDTTKGPFGWCNRCNFKWWPGKDEDDVGIDPETIKKLQQQARAREEREAEKRRKKLAEFTTQELWIEYCERMEDAQKEWWVNQGIPKDVQGYLSLGFKPKKKYIYNNEYHTSPAFTIPWFDYNFTFQTMQYRLTESVDPKDKYRFEYGFPGGSSLFFRADPGDEIGDKVIICEGAKKGMVVRYRLLPVETDFVVIASASKNTLAPALEAVKDSGLVYVILDPDGVYQANKAKEILGKRAHVINLPFKIDDGFLRYHFTQEAFGSVLSTVL